MILGARRRTIKELVVKHLLRKLLLVAVLGTSLSALAPGSVQADSEDRYWRHYWRWYDHTYRPYYHHRYYYTPPPTYAYPPPTSPFYGAGTTTFYGPAYPSYTGGGVVIGPLRYGWW